MISVERVRAVWHRAASYPSNKELVYPDHAKAQEFDKVKGAMVLEYGCGGGSDAMSYLRRSCLVWYVDIVPANVSASSRRIAQAGLNKRAYGLVIDESDKIPIVGGVFDVVNAHGVLHHIEDPIPVVREFHRLLKPRGLLYAMLYTEHLKERCMPAIRDLMEGRKLAETEAFAWCTDEEGAPYARAYTEEEGRQLLETCGFEVLSTTMYNQNDFRTFKVRR